MDAMNKLQLVLVIAVFVSSFSPHIKASSESESSSRQFYYQARDDQPQGAGHQPDAAYYASMEQQVHPEVGQPLEDPYSQPPHQPSYDPYYYTSPRPDSNNHYYPVMEQKDGSSYSYSKKPPGKKKKPEKEDDFLWELFFGKKDIFELLLGHHKKKPDKPSHSYGEPPAAEEDHETKEFAFKKIKIMAIAATALLILLGGGIVLAPLLIGKGLKLRRSLMRMITSPERMASLSEKVLNAIQSYELLNAE